MTHPNRRRGNRHEREIVEIAEEFGFDAKRAWGSNGKNLGEVRECDCLAVDKPNDIELRLSAKKRKNIANYLEPPEGTDGIVLRENYGENLIVLRFKEFLRMLREAYEQ